MCAVYHEVEVEYKKMMRALTELYKLSIEQPSLRGGSERI